MEKKSHHNYNRTERFEELEPRVQAVFDACVSFIKTAHKKGEDTII